MVYIMDFHALHAVHVLNRRSDSSLFCMIDFGGSAHTSRAAVEMRHHPQHGVQALARVSLRERWEGGFLSRLPCSCHTANLPCCSCKLALVPHMHRDSSPTCPTCTTTVSAPALVNQMELLRNKMLLPWRAPAHLKYPSTILPWFAELTPRASEQDKIQAEPSFIVCIGLATATALSAPHPAHWLSAKLHNPLIALVCQNHPSAPHRSFFVTSASWSLRAPSHGSPVLPPPSSLRLPSAQLVPPPSRHAH